MDLSSIMKPILQPLYVLKHKDHQDERVGGVRLLTSVYPVVLSAVGLFLQMIVPSFSLSPGRPSVRRNMKHFVALMELSLQSSIGEKNTRKREGRKEGRKGVNGLLLWGKERRGRFVSIGRNVICSQSVSLLSGPHLVVRPECLGRHFSRYSGCLPNANRDDFACLSHAQKL